MWGNLDFLGSQTSTYTTGKIQIPCYLQLPFFVCLLFGILCGKFLVACHGGLLAIASEINDEPGACSNFLACNPFKICFGLIWMLRSPCSTPVQEHKCSLEAIEHHNHHHRKSQHCHPSSIGTLSHFVTFLTSLFVPLSGPGTYKSLALKEMAKKPRAILAGAGSESFLKPLCVIQIEKILILPRNDCSPSSGYRSFKKDGWTDEYTYTTIVSWRLRLCLDPCLSG